MKAHLLFPDRDIDLKAEPPGQWRAVAQDLELDTLLAAMAADDAFLHEVASSVLLAATGEGDARIIAWRQAALRDALEHAPELRALYALVVEAIEGRKKHLFGISTFGRYPRSNLHGAVDLLQTYMQMLRRLRQQADSLSGGFRSEAFGTLFTTLQREIGDDYFAEVQDHLDTLRFRRGVLLSANLGPGNAGTGHVLHAGSGVRSGWLAWLLHKAPPQYVFRLADRDEAGARMLSELVDRGINEVANALAQATEHVLGFFELLRVELAFFVACLNLHERLGALGVATCMPAFHPAGTRHLTARALRDPALALTLQRTSVENDLDADGKVLLAVTGANEGGKSTFLRALGLAQIMLHAGMFVASETYAGELARGVFTHYKREEDATLQGGKLDEELLRMSTIAERIVPGALWLSNESFASTNAREGSELLLQVLDALRERGIKAVLVTHLVDAARRLVNQAAPDTLLLRAQRRNDGTRSFKLVVGAPLQTSFGADLYAEVFGSDSV